MKKYKKKGSKLIMLGKGIHYNEAPQVKPEDTDIWAINDLIYSRQDIDLIWEMHDAWSFSVDQLQHVKYADKMKIPTMMTNKYKGMDYILEFPLDDIVKKFNSDYFMTGIAYMMAYAIHLDYKQIDMWGCNMGGIGEIYKNAKSCVEYWIGRAEGAGIKVNLHGKHNRLLKTFDRRLYGYLDKFQWMPEAINDKSLYFTFGCTLSNEASMKLYKLLRCQKNSNYANNFKPIPYSDLSDENYFKRKLIEDAINYNIHNLTINQYEQPKFAGDLGFYYLPYYENLITVHHTFKMIYLTDTYENIRDSWFELVHGYNLWTKQDSLYWNSDKAHPKYDHLFPKYDLPKEDAFQAYYEFYTNKANHFARIFPKHIMTADKSILDTEEGQKQILAFIGYEEKDMVTSFYQPDNRKTSFAL
jgi:hypothetical protein